MTLSRRSKNKKLIGGGKQSRKAPPASSFLRVGAYASLLFVVLFGCLWHTNPSRRRDSGLLFQDHESANANANTITTSSNSTSNNLALKQSYGLLKNIPNAQWEKVRTDTKQRSWYANPDNPLDRIEETVWWNANNLLPTFDCPQMGRIGGTADNKEGTKFMCAPENFNHRGDCLIYSIGSAGDFKWEDAVAELHSQQCEIHIFDPADWSRPGDAENKNIHYHSWGIASSYDTESKSVVWPKGRKGGFKTFQETLRELGHEDRTMDIFKIDCEGCEWSSHKDWIGHGMRQILVEMHGVPTPKGTPQARWYQKPMDVTTEYWQDFADHGYALYSRDPNGDMGMELAFLKLDEDFWKE